MEDQQAATTAASGEPPSFHPTPDTPPASEAAEDSSAPPHLTQQAADPEAPVDMLADNAPRPTTDPQAAASGTRTLPPGGALSEDRLGTHMCLCLSDL